MPTLKHEWPAYMASAARQHFRRVRLKNCDPVHHRIFEFAILAPGGDEIAKDAEGKELRWVTGDPEEIQAIKLLAIELNRQRAAAVPPDKKGGK